MEQKSNDSHRPQEVDHLRKRQDQRRVRDFTRVGDSPEISKSKNSGNGAREIREQLVIGALDRIVRYHRTRETHFEKTSQQIQHEKFQKEYEKFLKNEMLQKKLQQEEEKIKDLDTISKKMRDNADNLIAEYNDIKRTMQETLKEEIGKVVTKPDHTYEDIYKKTKEVNDAFVHARLLKLSDVSKTLKLYINGANNLLHMLEQQGDVPSQTKITTLNEKIRITESEQAFIKQESTQIFHDNPGVIPLYGKEDTAVAQAAREIRNTHPLVPPLPETTEDYKIPKPNTTSHLLTIQQFLEKTRDGRYPTSDDSRQCLDPMKIDLIEESLENMTQYTGKNTSFSTNTPQEFLETPIDAIVAECDKPWEKSEEFTQARMRIANELCKKITEKLKQIDINILINAEEAIVRSINSNVININRNKKEAKESEHYTEYKTELINNINILKDYHHGIPLDPRVALYHFLKIRNRGNRQLRSDAIRTLDEEFVKITDQSAANINSYPYCWPQRIDSALSSANDPKREGLRINMSLLLNRIEFNLTEQLKNKEMPSDHNENRNEYASSTRETSQIKKEVRNRARDLATIIENQKSYQGFPITEESTLMLCGYNGKKKLEELTKDEWLYLEGTVNGTKQTLARHNDQSDEKLTGEYLVTIQKEFIPKEETKGSFGNTTEMTGFRNQNTTFAIGTNNRIGYQEWKEQCDKWNNDSNHKLHRIFMTDKEIGDGKAINAVEYNNEAFAVVVNYKREKPQLNKAINYFFEEYDNSIQAADNFFQKYDKDVQNDEKLEVIARTTHWLAKGQLFNDANSRVTAYCTLRKLLLKNGLGPTIIEKEQTHIFKTGSTSAIYGTIRYGQQLFEYYKENSNKYLELIKKGTFHKESFEAKFNEQRKKREEDFKNRISLEKNFITCAYRSFEVHEKMKKVKQQTNKITKEQLEGDMKDGYLFAKKIGEHIENIFIDKNYSDEASMESLSQINTDISSLYNALQSIQSPDPLFQDLCILSQRIQQAQQKATTKNALDSKYLNVSDNFETASIKSGKSSHSSYKGNEELVSVASEEERTFSNTNRRQSLISAPESTSSQMLDISTLPPNLNTSASELNPN